MLGSFLNHFAVMPHHVLPMMPFGFVGSGTHVAGFNGIDAELFVIGKRRIQLTLIIIDDRSGLMVSD